MAELESPGSPRKKIKLSNQVDGSEDSTPAVASGSPISTQTQKELDVGITSYVSSHTPAFSGILKKRYTDFLVNEILPNGEVLHLRSTKPPRQNPGSSDDQRAPAVWNGNHEVAAELKAENAGDRVIQAAGAESSNTTGSNPTVSKVETTNEAILEVRHWPIFQGASLMFTVISGGFSTSERVFQ